MRRGPKPAKSTEAKPPVARKSPKNDGAKVRDLEKRLAEALEREKAAGEILRVISSSPASVQPTFEAIARAAMSLCEADIGSLFRFDGQLIHVGAFHGTPEETEASRRAFPQRPSHGSVTARAILAATVVQIDDVSKDPEAADALRAFRTVLSVPMMGDGRPLGAITVARRVVRPFSDEQIALLQTFADQAVIAIENVRLFNETKEALEQQTATSSILQVIAASPIDLRPVFETILRSARELCGGFYSLLFLCHGEQLNLAATDNVPAEGLEALNRRYPVSIVSDDAGLTARAIRERRLQHVTDIQSEPSLPEAARRASAAVGQRAGVAVPLLREGEPVGALTVSRQEARAFSEKELALLQTFADQAVIAIENVRLFTELEARNRDLAESLQQQTATAEILKVISRSPTDIQPVLDAVAMNAAVVCGATDAIIMRAEGPQMRRVAHFGPIPLVMPAVRPLTEQTSIARAIVECRAIHLHDISAPEALREFPDNPGASGAPWRTTLYVPLVREGEAIGAISIRRTEVRPFTDRQIALLQTFADQAVIAIENVRLFTELQSSNAELRGALEQQTATSELLKLIGRSTFDLQPVFETLAENAVRLCEGHQAGVFRFDGQVLRVVAIHNASPELKAFLERNPVVPGRASVAGHAALEHRTLHIHDVRAHPEYTWGITQVDPIRTVLMTPMLRAGQLLGLIGVNRLEVRAFSDSQIALLETFADQAAIAIENVRLFKELEASNHAIAEKSRQLEAASQHKSEFLANMSHELRTPLNAIIGYSEMLQEEARDGQQDAFISDLGRINAAAKHQLELINDILDLSKVEAGKMELELTDFHLPTAIDNALTLVRERAGRRGITLQATVDGRLGEVRGDERKIKQVVLNLLSNAIKFTPEGGRIDVRALPVEGGVEVSVSDTGVGIAPEDQDAVFEEFRQVGTSPGRQEGTGLGLTLCRKFVELHGGRIWVKSQVGAGSTFTFTVPA